MLSTCALLLLFTTSSSETTLDESISAAKQLRDLEYSAAHSYERLQKHSDLVIVNQKGIPFESVSGYRGEDVENQLQKTKSKLLGTLDSSEYTAMMSYVSENFPEVKLTKYVISSAPEASCSVTPCPNSIIEPKSAEMAFNTIYEFVSKVANSSAYKVTFEVTSAPSGARFAITPIGGSDSIEIATDGRIENVFRGLYRYTVERSGFKTSTARLNLVDSAPTRLHCVLTPNTSEDTPIPCLSGLIE